MTPGEAASGLPPPRPEDLAHAGRRDEPARRAATLERRLRLRALAARLLGVDGVEVAITQPPDGRPALVAPRPLHAALAARDGCSVVAVSPEPIGVDVERIEPGAHRPLDLLHPTTAAGLATVDDAGFAEGWAGLEAYLKLLGVGVDGLSEAILTPGRAAWAEDGRAAARLDLRRAGAFVFAAATFG